MPAAAFYAAMRLIGFELTARTVNDHNPLARFARRPVGITGNPITGWEPAR